VAPSEIDNTATEVDLLNEMDADVEILPARSVCVALIETVPSDAPEKSKLVDQTEEEHAAVPVASPEIEIDWPDSEQVPVTEKELIVPELMVAPDDGDVKATVGAMLSFTKDTES
tara:strand:+ start:234 stop:578 length:345 start_codon:yes stop_codon:yes gene_type:complete